jgi:hypothetical protein
MHKNNSQWKRKDLIDHPVLLRASAHILKSDPQPFTSNTSKPSPPPSKPASFYEWLKSVNQSLEASHPGGMGPVASLPDGGELVALREKLKVKVKERKTANEPVELLEEWIKTLNLVIN